MHAVSECTFSDPRVYVSVFAPLCMLSCPSSVRVFEHVKRTEVITICSMNLINRLGERGHIFRVHHPLKREARVERGEEVGEGGAGGLGGRRLIGEGESR